MVDSYANRALLVVLIVLTGCVYRDIPAPTPVSFDCSQSTLAISVASKTDASSCFAIDGSLTVHASGGSLPYLFSFNGANYQTDSTKSGIGPGTYLVTVQDANLCTKSISVVISAGGTSLTASATVVNDTDCLTDNGSFVVTASGGHTPYTYQFGTSPPGSITSFTGLKSGYYTVTVRDSTGCIQLLNVWVHRGDTGTSYASVIKPILDTNCSISGCHNGDNGASRNWTVFENVKNNALHIKQRTQDKSMPLGGTLTQDQINLIACWVDDGAKDN